MIQTRTETGFLPLLVGAPVLAAIIENLAVELAIWLSDLFVPDPDAPLTPMQVSERAQVYRAALQQVDRMTRAAEQCAGSELDRQALGAMRRQIALYVLEGPEVSDVRALVSDAIRQVGRICGAPALEPQPPTAEPKRYTVGNSGRDVLLFLAAVAAAGVLLAVWA